MTCDDRKANIERWLYSHGFKPGQGHYTLMNDALMLTTDPVTANKVWRDRAAMPWLNVTIHDPNQFLFAHQKADDMGEFDNARLSNHNLIGASVTMNSQLYVGTSRWLENPTNLAIFSRMTSTTIIYRNDPINGYPVAAIFNPQHPQRLNKPIEVLSQGNLHTWDEPIAQTRLQAIQMAIASSGEATLDYEHIWRGQRWALQHSVVILSEQDEILVTVPDRDRSQSDPSLWARFV